MTYYTQTCMQAIESLFPDDILQIMYKYVQPRKIRIKTSTMTLLNAVIRAKITVINRFNISMYNEHIVFKIFKISTDKYGSRSIRLTLTIQGCVVCSKYECRKRHGGLNLKN